MVILLTIRGIPIKTSDFDFITAAAFFSKCNFISHGCEAKMWILTDLSLIYNFFFMLRVY